MRTCFRKTIWLDFVLCSNTSAQFFVFHHLHYVEQRSNNADQEIYFVAYRVQYEQYGHKVLHNQ